MHKELEEGFAQLEAAQPSQPGPMLVRRGMNAKEAFLFLKDYFEAESKRWSDPGDERCKR